MYAHENPAEALIVVTGYAQDGTPDLAIREYELDTLTAVLAHLDALV